MSSQLGVRSFFDEYRISIEIQFLGPGLIVHVILLESFISER